MMKRLLNKYKAFGEMHYFEQITDHVINGHLDLAKEQFSEMPIEHMKMFVRAARGRWTSGLSQEDIEEFSKILELYKYRLTEEQILLNL